MKYLSSMVVVLGFAFSLSAHATALGLKPGLWQINYKINNDGKEIDPQAELKKALAKMSPEQRAQMTAMMAKQGGVSMDESGMKVCYTKDLLEQGKALGHDPNNQCETHVSKQSTKLVTMDFKCKDGSTGVGEWKMPTPATYDGLMTFTKKDGKITKIAQQGKFVSADCGDVKPLKLPASK